jgi:transposase
LVSVIEGIKPQIEGFIQQIEAQRNQIEAQHNQIAQMEFRIKELESQINQNSRNSSRPPSSDVYRKQPAFPRAKGGKIGGKKGHDGGTLKMVEVPDKVIEHKPEVCSHCGKIHSQERLVMRGRRQVFDIPPPRLEVTEHRVLDWVCSNCRNENRGQFPAWVSGGCQYGFGLQTMSVLFNNTYNIPRNKIQLIFKDLYGVSLNEGTLQSQQEFAYAQLEADEQHIKTLLLQSEVVHFDETGFYVGKERNWEHSASNERYTYLFVHRNRGKKAHEAGLSILPHFKQWAIHDCWATYFNFVNCKHGTCGTHLIRELNALIENKSKWATQFHAFLIDLYRQTDHGKGKLPLRKQAKTLTQYNKLLKTAEREEPPPIQRPRGKPKQTKGRNLMDRLKKHQDAVLAFAFHKEVPFTNNQAERDIRPTKTKMKVSGCFRTDYGAEIYARIQSFVSTVRKLQFNPFNELYTVLSGGIPDYRSNSC